MSWIFGLGGFVWNYWWVFLLIIAAVVIVAMSYLGRSLFDVLRAVVDFFRTPLGQAIGAAVILYFLLSGVWQAGGNYERTKCREASLARELAEEKRDRDAAEDARRNAQAALDESQERLKANEQKVDEYAKALAKRPDAACILTDDDIRRLRPSAR